MSVVINKACLQRRNGEVDVLTKRILIIIILKNLLHQLWNSPTLQLSPWLRECDRAYFAILFRQKTVINLFAILRVFRVGLGI